MYYRRKQITAPLRGKGEIRGYGLLHKLEFTDCPKDCTNPAHCVRFTKRNAEDGLVNTGIGAIIGYTAFSRHASSDVAATLRPLHKGE